MSSSKKFPSDKSFGITFSIVFALAGGWMAHKNHAHYAVPVVVSAIFLLLSFVSPRLLHPLNIAWMKLGAFLHKVMNPLVLGGIYFFLITPIAIFFRLKGRDVMQQRFDPLIETYWVKRNPAGPESKSFSRQF